MSAPATVLFGGFELNLGSGELRRQGALLKLAPQPFKVLELLTRHPGEVVTRNEIRDHVWHGDTFVDFEQGLNFCIRQIREVLGDTADAPRFIETLPRRGYRFLMAVKAGGTAAGVTRLIVLPFRMLRPDPDLDFLAFSLPDALTASLGGLESLVVRSSVAAARFVPGSEPTDHRKIAAQADVDVIVTGTLLSAGREVRVATQLTDAITGTLLWSNATQAPVGDVFRVQDELTQRIVASLALPLTRGEQQLLKRDVPANAAAYEFFLRGNQLASDAKQWVVARELYQRSVEEDPRYAPAWARLGRINHVIGKYLPSGTAVDLAAAETAFRRALDLNPDLTLAHKLYAQLEVDLGRGRDAMARLIERAHVADPELLAGLVTTCRYCGLLDASVAAHTRAAELEPKIRTSLPHTLFLQRDYARLAAATLAENPYIVALALAEVSRGHDALTALRDLEPKTPTRMRDFIGAARTLLEGDVPASVAAVNRVVGSDFRDPEALYYMARQLSHLGQSGPALDVLHRVVGGGFFCFPAMATDPWLDPLRKKPAFGKVLGQAGARHDDALATFERLGGNKVLAVAATVGS